ncbi:MAG: hypothetical protein K2H30_03290, partial [Clostridia bacterium]|nr:hypothetical protein [Clostridia bacterium]
SEYFSAEVYEGTWKQTWTLNAGGAIVAPGYVYSYENADTNAFIMQQWVQLDFDIIDLTFTKDAVETVIPVIMSPMDIVADGDHPIVTTKDSSGLEWWQILLGIIALLIIVLLLLKFCPAIIFVLGKIIVIPFKCIGAFCKSITRSIKKVKERRRKRMKMQSEKAINQTAKEEKHKQKKQASDTSSYNYDDEFLDDIDFDEVWQAIQDGKL